MQLEPRQEPRGRSLSFICLGIYKSLTWYSDLIKRKQNTHRGWVSSLAPILPKRHTHERLGFGGLLSWNQSDAQKAGLLCEQKEGSLPHTHTGGCGLSKLRPLESGLRRRPGWCWVHVFSPEQNQSLQPERGSRVIQEMARWNSPVPQHRTPRPHGLSEGQSGSGVQDWGVGSGRKENQAGTVPMLITALLKTGTTVPFEASPWQRDQSCSQVEVAGNRGVGIRSGFCSSSSGGKEQVS